MSGGLHPAARLGIVSDRRRLAAAVGRPLEQAAALLIAQVEAAAVARVAFFQLREPDLGGAALATLVRQLVAVASGRVRLVVNDRADVAAVAAADLHLKHASIDAARLRAWMPPGTWMSRAVHTTDDVAAAGPVNALIAGTAAPSHSKPAGSPTLGPGGLAALAAVAAQSGVPVFAIGGLGPADWPWVSESGAFGVAAIGAFLPRRGEDPGAAVERAVTAFAAAIDG